MEWGCFQYMVMAFGLKNSPVNFSRIVVAIFKDFIHKFLKVYFDDWTVFGLVKYHIEILIMILYQCQQLHISLILKKCIFCASFGLLMGDVVYRDGILMDHENNAIIVYLKPPSTMKEVRTTLGRTRYYRKFIR